MMDYKKAGVNIDEGNRAVDVIKPIVKKTHTSNVVSNIGGFAAGFKFPTDNYVEPILVSCTDGVGTKLRIAIEHNIVDTVGIDLVAMCVNDLICMGATPLFFLDYIATHAVDAQKMKAIITGIAQGCKQSGCALIGGEMAEMNDMYQKNDFDLAGFCVGVVDKPKVIDGSKIAPGDYVYALPSSGIHSNGYSLVRKVLTTEVCQANNIDPKELLIPTKIYVNQVADLIKNHRITGIANITGGGLAENTQRIVPKTVRVTIQEKKIQVGSIFQHIQSLGNINKEEMFRVFNMGVGMVVISPEKLEESDEIYCIGTVEDGQGDVVIV